MFASLRGALLPKHTPSTAINLSAQGAVLIPAPPFSAGRRWNEANELAAPASHSELKANSLTATTKQTAAVFICV